MKATAVNVRTAPHWDVYVGRGRCPRSKTRLGSARWGNPYTVAEHGPDAMRLYLDMLEAHPHVVDRARSELAGKVLGCWCVPGPCHATVLAKLANGEPLADVRREMLAFVAEVTAQPLDLFGGGR